MSDNVPAVQNPQELDAPLSAQAIRDQVNLIQSMMKEVMTDGQHYGKIPGCGDKPALLKPGAEKLCLTFKLAPDIQVTAVDMPNMHREYQVKVVLYSHSGITLGSGVGSACTMEGKWRFRTGNVELTNIPVPQTYWDKREHSILIGAVGQPGKYSTKKDDAGKWMIAIAGGKVEHDNPADYYNTCLKMAKKRALVDAVLTVTAASDIFTQDIEEMTEVLGDRTGQASSSGAQEKKTDTVKAKEKTPPAEAVKDKPSDVAAGAGEQADQPKLNAAQTLYQEAAIIGGLAIEGANKILDEVSGFDTDKGRRALKVGTILNPDKDYSKWAGSSLKKLREKYKVEEYLNDLPGGCGDPQQCDHSAYGDKVGCSVGAMQCPFAIGVVAPF